MMNCGAIPPDDGYLASLRELLHRHALLTFDEVKTGVTTRRAAPSSGAASRPTSSRSRRRSAAASILRASADRGGRAGRDRRHDRAGGHVQRESAFGGGGARRPSEILTPDVYERFRRAGAGAGRRHPRGRRPVRPPGDGRLGPLPGFRCTSASSRSATSATTRRPTGRSLTSHGSNAAERRRLPAGGGPWTFSLAHTDEDSALRGRVRAFAADVTV